MKINILLGIALALWVVIAPEVSLAANFFTSTTAFDNIASKIPVIGRIDNATQSWSGSLITNFDVWAGHTVNGSVPSQEMYFDNVNQSFSGFFVLTAACATTDCKKTDGSNNWDDSAFVTFLNDANKAYLVQSWSTDIYKMKWFAWSKSSGWISFDTGRTDTVIYDRSTWSFDGFAWSKNLWYISMKGLVMLSKAPDINMSHGVMVAYHDATLGTGSIVIPDGLGEYKLEFTGTPTPKDLLWSDKPIWTGSTAVVEHMDFRLAWSYNYTYTDPFGNSSGWPLKVVANIPNAILYAGGSDPLFKIDSANPKANGSDKQSIIVNLHDTYGNMIKEELPYKKVNFTLGIKNTISPNQTNFSVVDTDNDTSIAKNWYSKSIQFGGNLDATSEFSIQRTSSVNYTNSGYSKTYTNVNSWTLNIASYMSTDSTNKLEITTASYVVESLLGDTTNVWQTVVTDFVTLPQDMNFTQVGSGTFTLRSWALGKFGLGLPFDTDPTWTQPPNVWSSLKTYHLYNTQTGSISLGWVLSFSGIATWSTVVDQSYTPSRTWRYIKKPATDDDFTLIPQVDSALTQIDFDLQHQVLHTFNAGWFDFLYKVGGATSTWATQNRWIKILGSASSGNKDAIFALNDTDTYAKVGNFRKPQVRDMVTQNVEALKRNTPSDVAIITTPGEKLSSYVSKQAIIVVNHDFTIDTNWWSKTDSPRAIIVIGGDVKIDSGVQTIYASIFTDHGIKASASSDKQLYIYGTLISGNTIGTTAKLANTVCPDFLTSCTEQQKKDYDLNFLRSGSSNPVAPLSSEYSLVIEYNPKLTSDPPPGFKKIAR